MAGGGREAEGGGALYVLALAAMVAPALLVSRLEAAVPRRARSRLPRAVPSGWWSSRISFFPPPPPQPDQSEGQEKNPGPQRPAAAAKDPPEKQKKRKSYPRPRPDPGAAGERPAKRPKRCLHCNAAETPQRRSGPMGRGTLCNACGVWYNKTGALPELVPVDPPVESPISEPEEPGAIYLVRRSAAERRPPRTEAPAPRPATSCLNCGSSEPPELREGPMGRREVCTACGERYKKGRRLPECQPAVRPVTDSPPHSPITANSPPDSPIWEPEAPRSSVCLARKSSKNGKTPWRPKDTGKSCMHCGSVKTPQWREGPMGRGTLCNACGVRYKQGRLLPEYRPMASPTFLPSQHANHHRQVLRLHKQKPRSNDQEPSQLPPGTNGVNQKWESKDQEPSQLPPATHSVTKLTPIRDKHQTNMPDCSYKEPVCDDHPTDMPGCTDEEPVEAPGCTHNPPIDVPRPSSLDSLLLDGPSAPLIVESDEFAIS